jgi:hypothetical protein
LLAYPASKLTVLVAVYSMGVVPPIGGWDVRLVSTRLAVPESTLQLRSAAAYTLALKLKPVL